VGELWIERKEEGGRGRKRWVRRSEKRQGARERENEELTLRARGNDFEQAAERAEREARWAREDEIGI